MDERQPDAGATIAEARRERESRARASALRSPGFAARVASVAHVAQADWRRAPAQIARAIREASGLPSAERRLFAEALHGWVRFRRRLAFVAGRPLDDADEQDLAAMVVVWLSTQAGPLDGDAIAALQRAGIAQAKVETAEMALARIADPAVRLGVALSYPDWMVARVVDAYGPADGEALLAAMNRRAPLTVRANLLRCTREQLAARLAELGIPSRPTKLAAHGLVLDTHVNVYGLAPFRDGWLELQDEGSQVVAEIVAPPPRSTAIDACAGAGGKTLALGAALHNRGRLVALDVDEEKLVELRTRARRAGLTNVQAMAVAAGEVPAAMRSSTAAQHRDAALHQPADRVLVDAPCTGLGVIRRNPETKWRVQPTDPLELAAKQQRILHDYAPLVKPGGRLVYATCSIMADENDTVVDKFRADHPDFEVVPVKEVIGKQGALEVGDGTVVRLLPHVHDTDGFFAAILRRTR